jgi:hypothetical protein
MDDKACVGLVRVEGGSVKEIGFVIGGSAIDGTEISGGSAILVGSVSDLGRQGLTGHTEDSADSQREARGRHSGGCYSTDPAKWHKTLSTYFPRDKTGTLPLYW